MAQQNAQLKALCTVMRHSTGVIRNDLQQEIGTISDERNDIRDRYNTLLETAAGDYIQHHRELHWLKRAQRNEALKSQCYDTFKKGMFFLRTTASQRRQRTQTYCIIFARKESSGSLMSHIMVRHWWNYPKCMARGAGSRYIQSS